MCGICGELSLGEQPVRESSIRAMAEAIHYRGPDDRGFHVEDRVGLGHLRLSIIDTSSRGHQPMWSADGRLCIVFNGEIYNYREIARDLEAGGCRFRSTSDTEVVVNAVQVWGVEDAVRRFIGMFAFAIWDRIDGVLTLVRDRVGIKPLFYALDDRRALFGSEVRAILAHPEYEKKIDRRGLGQFFVTGYTLGSTTAFQNLRRLLPGHIATITRDGTVRETEYWSLTNVSRSHRSIGVNEAAEELQSLLESAVGYRLVSDVPVANFLSGGVDSSLVASILKKNLGQDVLNITIGFREAAFDEAPKASVVARALGLNHVVHYVEEREVNETLGQFAEIFDEPFGDTSGIPTYILSRVARQHVKVALSADGGDEQFCGYDSYARYAATWNALQRLPVQFRQAASAVGRRLPWRAIAGLASMRGVRVGRRPQTFARIEKALRIGSVSTSSDLVRTMFEKAWTWDEAKRLVGAEGGPLFDRSVLADPELAASDGDLVDTMMRADYRAFLRDDILTKVDRASMHVSLEARDPMLDHRLAEFAFGLPLSLLNGQGQDKRLLKTLLLRTVPADVVNSPKRGFSIPLYAWMRTVWKPAVQRHLSKESVDRVGILAADEVQNEVTRFYRHAGGSAERIWMLLNFQMWAERWLN